MTDCPCCGDPRPPVRWGELAVSLESGPVWAGRPLPLPRKLRALLHHLARRAPATVSADALILSSLGEDADEPLLRSHLTRLRRWIEAHGVPLLILSDPGQGYRLASQRANCDVGSRPNREVGRRPPPLLRSVEGSPPSPGELGNDAPSRRKGR